MHFENEKLDLINAEKEFEITLRGMLAQDESRNTSENIQWGFQRKFEKGDIFTKYKNFMGYDCVDGEMIFTFASYSITEMIAQYTSRDAIIIFVISLYFSKIC